jgi:transcriptional regulator with XRE-family HTH domain
MSKRPAERKKRTARKKPIPKERIIFARNLRTARKATGQSQGAIGKIAGLAQPFISEVELGKTTVSLDNAAHLADAVGIPLYKLLMPYPQDMESEAKPSDPGAGRSGAQ